MGEDALLDLSAQNYLDRGLWKLLTATSVLPPGFNITQSPATAVGGVVVLNDVRTKARAYVVNATVNAAPSASLPDAIAAIFPVTTAIGVSAHDQAVIHATADVTSNSSGGSSITGEGRSLAVNAVITTNWVLTEATATVDDSVLVATGGGDVVVTAANVSQIDALTRSASATGAQAAGIQLAFNTVGWKPTNLFFKALDALIGDPAIETNTAFGGEQPALTVASISNSRVSADGDVTISADSAPSVFALVSNDATSAPAAMFGAGGMTVGAVLASNMINAEARSSADYTPIGSEYTLATAPGLIKPGDRIILGNGKVYEFVGAPRGPPSSASEIESSSDWRQLNYLHAGQDVTVSAQDAAEIGSATTMKASVAPTNDAGAGLLNNWAGSVLDDYDYTSKSGTQTLSFGDTVRVADDADEAIAGKVFKWMGTTQSVDLGATDYSDFELWKELTATNLITDDLAYAVLGEIGTRINKEGVPGASTSYYGLIDHNDVRSVVSATLDGLFTSAGRDLFVVALDKATIAASEDSTVTSWTGLGGIIATNVILSSADATLHGGAASAGRDLWVDAEHLAQIDATTTSAIGSDENGAWDAKSLIVAFNSIGWKSTNLFFNAAEALTSASDYLYDHTSGETVHGLNAGTRVSVLTGAFAGRILKYAGTTQPGIVDLSPTAQNYADRNTWIDVTSPYVGQQPSSAVALVQDTALSAGRDLNVNAVSGSQVNALVGNDNTVDASVNLLFSTAASQKEQAAKKKKDGTKTKGKIAGYGASGVAGGIVLASNKVSSLATASIEYTTRPCGSVDVGGDLDGHRLDAPASTRTAPSCRTSRPRTTSLASSTSSTTSCCRATTTTRRPPAASSSRTATSCASATRTQPPTAASSPATSTSSSAPTTRSSTSARSPRMRPTR